VALRKIQELREARGWSRSELARQARMDAGDVSKIERGILVPYPGQIMKIAWALGVTATEIANEMKEGDAS
jgi:ribosome-binding protein aMBF1 (putative translation factor)